MSNEPDETGRTELKVMLGRETANALRFYMDAKGVSEKEAVRRAIGLLHYVTEEQMLNDNVILVAPRTGSKEHSHRLIME